MSYECYIASGWFNPEQAKDLEDIKEILDNLKCKYYSPKDEEVCPPTAPLEVQKKVFQSNITSILNSKFVIVNTRDKDMGTIFEAGVSYALKIPIIYYCSGLSGSFNLMLSRSGVAVATNLTELFNHVRGILQNPKYKKEYTGGIQ